MKLIDIAKALQIPCPAGQEEMLITGVGSVGGAKESEICFIRDESYLKDLKNSKACAALVPKVFNDLALTQLVVKNPQRSFITLTHLLHPKKIPAPGIDPDAIIGEGAKIHPEATIMAGARIGRGTTIGRGTVVMPYSFIGHEVQIGQDGLISPQVYIGDGTVMGDRVVVHGGAVVGGDGFGFVFDEEGRAVKVPHLGTVVIHDDCELGANCTIDRGALDQTVLGKGVKLDSQVHIGHNAQIGDHCLFAANTSIAGSAVVGRHVVSGGLAGIAGHIAVGDGVRIGAMTGVVKDALPKETYMGFPAQPARQWHRQLVYVKKLEGLFKTVERLKQLLS